jgi:hypothetical protein
MTVERALAALRALGPTIEERERAEEQQWRESLREWPNLPGWYSYTVKRDDFRMVSNESARRAWTDCNDPEPLMVLLRGGRADLRSQHMAAEIILYAASRKLPTPKATKAYRTRRDQAIAELVHGLRKAGMTAGRAQHEAAKAFRVSDDHVKATCARPDLRDHVVLAEFERKLKRRGPTAG